jgi:hypothetical protein
MNFLKFKKRSLVGLAVFMLAVIICHAQNPNATVSGTVTDSSGAVIGNANVEIKNVDTGITYPTVTNSEGTYRIPGLIPGNYRVTVSKEGFKNVIKDGIELHVEDLVSLNFSLQIGSNTESVTVEAGEPLIDTQSTSLGQVIEGRQVQDTPLNGRNPMNLVALVPGVIPQGQTSGPAASNQGAGFTNPAAYGNYQISGGIAGWNATYVDGATVNASGQNWQALVPTQDSIAEFKVDTNSVTPQYGRFAGGVINFSTKSGTDSFHGSAYNYLRNTDLDANTYINNLQDQPRNVLIQNQFGARIGGPIIKDKTFFFFSWETTRLNTTAAFARYVPTPAEMSGDFRLSPATLANGVTIDPKTGAPATCNGVANTVCANELDPTAAAMYANNYFMLPDPALIQQMVSNPTAANNPNNPVDVKGITKTTNDTSQYVARVDHRLTDKQNLFARYSYWKINIPFSTGQIAAPVFPGTGLNSVTHQAVLGDTYSISPTLTTDVRFSYTRYLYDVNAPGNGNKDLSFLGPNWATIGSEIPYKAAPVFFPGISWANMPFMLDLQQSNHNDIYALNLGFAKVLGQHNISFGGEARRVEYYTASSIAPSGNFAFLGENGIANFAEGVVTPVPSLSNINTHVAPSAYEYYQGYYVTDTFRATSKLTANVGVRWELPGSWHTRANDNTVLLPNAPNPLGSFLNPVTGSQQSLTGILAVVNSPQYSSSGQTEQHWHLFEPRVGLNYALTPSTVVRAGFGITSPCIDCGSASTEAAGSPLTSATTLASTSLSNPFPNGVLLPLQRNLNIMQPFNQFPQTLLGAVVGGQEPYQKYPYVMQWNLNVEKSLGSSASFLLSYSGSHGVHLGSNDVDINQLPDQYDSMGAQLLTQVNNPFAGQLAPAGGLNGPTVNTGQLLRPYPEFPQFNSFGQYRGSSEYNALISQFTKRFVHGATFNVAYTWGHLISTLDSANGYLEAFDIQTGFGPQDFTNPSSDRSDSAADIRQRLVLSYVLDLPFGKGRRFLDGTNATVDHIVSGWTLSGITTFQTGTPIGIQVNGGNNLTNLFGAGQLRPNVVPGCDKTVSGSWEQHIHDGTPVFNTNCFAGPGLYSFGNESRLDSTLRLPGINNFDVDLAKRTPITENVSLEFHAQFFNIMNHPQFTLASASNISLASATTLPGASQPSFGIANGTTANQPRIGQLSLRVNF